MNAPKPLQLPTHEEIEDARTNARLDAQAEYEDQIQYEREAMNDEPGDWCIYCGKDAETCEHYEEANQE